eukprot:TRINITY_DN4824_c0_g1_i11.p2 TRINITY_DN4824_c0_g1~~TRINITY_DN4824_c0_g1_i11.p2  ORF type:complete len:131 (-),score=53.12 TRINITY_DN4824_c0_g1_i11:73-465(-)
MVSGACKAGQKACAAGCKAAGGIVQGVAYSMEAGKGVLKATEVTMKAITSLIDKILSSIDFSITFGGSLSVEQFSFNIGFKLRIGSTHLDFQLNINLKTGGLGKLASSLFSRVKDYIFQKVPAIGKYIKK